MILPLSAFTIRAGGRWLPVIRKEDVILGVEGEPVAAVPFELKS